MSGEFAATKHGQRGVRCSKQRSIFVQNDGDRNIGKQRRKLAFVRKSLTEGAFSQQRQYFYRDAAGKIHTAVSQNAQRQISGLRAERIGPEIQRFDAGRAIAGERMVRDFLRRFCGRLAERIMAKIWVQKFVKFSQRKKKSSVARRP